MCGSSTERVSKRKAPKKVTCHLEISSPVEAFSKAAAKSSDPALEPLQVPVSSGSNRATGCVWETIHAPPKPFDSHTTGHHPTIGWDGIFVARLFVTLCVLCNNSVLFWLPYPQRCFHARAYGIQAIGSPPHSLLGFRPFVERLHTCIARTAHGLILWPSTTNQQAKSDNTPALTYVLTNTERKRGCSVHTTAPLEQLCRTLDVHR